MKVSVKHHSLKGVKAQLNRIYKSQNGLVVSGDGISLTGSALTVKAEYEYEESDDTTIVSLYSDYYSQNSLLEIASSTKGRGVVI